MKFSCDSCGAQYMIADTKIGPKGVKVRCKKCSQVIVLRVGKNKGDTKSVPPDEKPSVPAAAKANGSRPKAAAPDEEFTVSLSSSGNANLTANTNALLNELGTSSDLGVSTEFRAAGFDEDPVTGLPMTSRVPTAAIASEVTGSSPFEAAGLGGSASPMDSFGRAAVSTRTSEEEPATRVDFDPMSRPEGAFGTAGTPAREVEEQNTSVAAAPELAARELGGFGSGLGESAPFATAREMGALARAEQKRSRADSEAGESSESTDSFDPSAESTVGALDAAPSHFPSVPTSPHPQHDVTAESFAPPDDHPSSVMPSSHEELESELGSAFDAVFGGAEAEPGANDPFAAIGSAGTLAADKLPTRVLDTGSVDSLNQKARAAEATVATQEPVEWFVAINDEQVGPLGFQEIQSHWDRKTVDANTLCWRAGMSDWVQVRFVPELEALGPMDAAAPAPEESAPTSARTVAPLRTDTPEPATGLAAMGLAASFSPSVSASLRQSSPPRSRPAWSEGTDSLTDQLSPGESPSLAATAPVDEAPLRPKLEIVPSVPPPSARLGTESLGSTSGLLGQSSVTLGGSLGAVPEHPGDDEPSWRPSAASALASLAAEEVADSGKKKPGLSGGSTLPPPSDALSSLLSEPSMTGLQAFKSSEPDDSSASLSPLPKAAPDVAAVAASRPTVGRRPNWALIGIGGMGLVIVMLLSVLLFRSPTPPAETPAEKPTHVAQASPPPNPAPNPAQPVAPVGAPDAGVAPAEATPEPPLPVEDESAKLKKKEPDRKKSPPPTKKKEPAKDDEEEEPPPRRAPEPPPDVDSLDPDSLLKDANRRTKRPVLDEDRGTPEQLEDDEILRELRKHKDEIRDCIDKQRRSDPRLEGKMTVKFVLLNSGRTSEHLVQPVKFDGSVVGRCILDSVRKWRFPKFSGKPMPIDFPVSL